MCIDAEQRLNHYCHAAIASEFQTFELRAEYPKRALDAGTLVGVSDGAASEYWRNLSASTRMDEQGFSVLPPDAPFVAEAHRQIARALAGSESEATPLPIGACFQDWGAPAFGGALHFWLPGTDPDAVREYLRQPVPGVGLHLCGEAWSDDPGWVDGALRNVEMLLRARFGLRGPEWLVADGTFG